MITFTSSKWFCHQGNLGGQGMDRYRNREKLPSNEGSRGIHGDANGRHPNASYRIDRWAAMALRWLCLQFCSCWWLPTGEVPPNVSPAHGILALRCLDSCPRPQPFCVVWPVATVMDESKDEQHHAITFGEKAMRSLLPGIWTSARRKGWQSPERAVRVCTRVG